LSGNRLIEPSSDDFCHFVEAYFRWQGTWDTKSRGGHDVYRIKGHPRNISVPRGRERIARLTFDGLLKDMGIDRAVYRGLAGAEVGGIAAYARAARAQETDADPDETRIKAE
jgi:hypothetical protein